MRYANRIAVLTAALLGGCAAPTHQIALPEENPALTELEIHARHASESIERLAASMGSHHGVQQVDIDAPPGMERLVTIDHWNGPLEPLVKEIAKATGYTYQEPIGALPVTPVMVVIKATNTRAIDVLDNAGSQAGAAADVIIRPATKTLLVKYPPVVHSGPAAAAR